MRGTVTALNKSGEYEGRKWYLISVLETGKQYAKKGITNDDPTPYLGQHDELEIQVTETQTDIPNKYNPGQFIKNYSFILPNHPEQAQTGKTTTKPQNVPPRAENKPQITAEQYMATIKRFDDLIMRLDMRVRDLEKNSKAPKQSLPLDFEEDGAPDPEPPDGI